MAVLSDAQRRAVIRARLDQLRAQDPGGETTALLWWVCNLLWRPGDPVLPEPLAPGREDRS